MSMDSDSNSIDIREVWEDNLEEEFALIRNVVDEYPCIAMDTEFPGVCLRPYPVERNSAEYNYKAVKLNVDMLKLIQLGLTFSNEQGNLPTCGTDKYCIWQFNFREFNENEDVYVRDSIELLRKSGIDFKKNLEKGIDAKRFGELLMSSGVVLNYDVEWIAFHSALDFGYLLKLLIFRKLPETEQEFYQLIKMYFPTVYDMKYMIKFCGIYGGLKKVAQIFDVKRVGMSHQAGSDSLLTAGVFRKMRGKCFRGPLEEYAGFLHGLGADYNMFADY